MLKRELAVIVQEGPVRGSQLPVAYERRFKAKLHDRMAAAGLEVGLGQLKRLMATVTFVSTRDPEKSGVNDVEYVFRSAVGCHAGGPGGVTRTSQQVPCHSSPTFLNTHNK